MTKDEVLRGAGYHYHFEREVYIDRVARKAFSVEFIEQHSADDLAELVRANPPGAVWQFFFLQAPSPEVQKELANVLDRRAA